MKKGIQSAMPPYSPSEKEILQASLSPFSSARYAGIISQRSAPLDLNQSSKIQYEHGSPSMISSNNPHQNPHPPLLISYKTNFHASINQKDDHEDLQRVCRRQDSCVLSEGGSKLSVRDEDLIKQQHLQEVTLNTNINSQLQSFEESDDLKRQNGAANGTGKNRKGSRLNYPLQHHDSNSTLNKKNSLQNLVQTTKQQTQSQQLLLHQNHSLKIDDNRYEVKKKNSSNNFDILAGISNTNCLNPHQFHLQVQNDRLCSDSPSKREFDDGTAREATFIRQNAKKVVQGSFKMITLILPKMRKFLLTKTLIGRQKLLSDPVRDFINDLCDFYHKPGKKPSILLNFLTKLLVFIETLCITLRLDRIPLFDPENLLKLACNTIIVLYNCFYLFVVSVEVVFSAHFTGATTLHYIAQGAWITELLLQVNTATYHHNTFTKDRKIIFKIYAKEYLLFEILPLLFEGRTSTNVIINILLHLPLLLKIKGIMIIIKKIEFYALQILEKHYILFLFQLCAKVFIFGHIIACTRRLISQFELHFMGIQYAWRNDSIQEGEVEWLTDYLDCLYWSFAIMMHNLSEKPANNIEYAYSCLVMLLSSIVFGFMLNSIGSLLADISKQQEEYKKDLNTLNSFMKRKKIDLSLRRRVNSNLLKHYHQQSRDKIIQEKEAIQKLTSYMQNELLTSSNQKILKMFPVFSETFSASTIQRIYPIMDEVVYAPNQIIFRTNSSYEDSIFLVLKGQVTLYLTQQGTDYQDNYSSTLSPSNTPQNQQQITLLFYEPPQFQPQIFPSYLNNLILRFLEDPSSSGPTSSKQGIVTQQQQQLLSDEHKKKKIMILRDGDCMGLYSFFAGQNKQLNAISNTFSTIIRINRNQFLDIVRSNKADFEKFMEIKDKILFDQRYKTIKNLECQICGSFDHTVSSCNRVYFDKTNSYIFHKHNYSPLQPRDEFFSRIEKRFRTSTSNQNAFFERIYEFQRANDLLDTSMMDDDSYDSQSSQSSVSKQSSLHNVNNSSKHPNQQQQQQQQQQSQPQQQQMPTSMTNIGQTAPSSTNQAKSSHSHNHNAADEPNIKKKKKKNMQGNGIRSTENIDIYTILSEAAEDNTHFPSRSYAFSKFTEKDMQSEIEPEEIIVTMNRRKSHAQINQHTRRSSYLNKAPSDLEQGFHSPKGIHIEPGQSKHSYSTILSAIGTLEDKTKVIQYRDPRTPILQNSFYDEKHVQGSQIQLHLAAAHNNGKQYPTTQHLQQQIQQQIQQQRLSNHFVTSQIFKRHDNMQSEYENALLAITQDQFEWMLEKAQEFGNYYPSFNITHMIRKANAFNYARINKKKKFVRQKSKRRTNTVAWTQKQQLQQQQAKMQGSSYGFLEMRSAAGGFGEPRSFINTKGHSNLSISKVSIHD